MTEEEYYKSVPETEIDEALFATVGTMTPQEICASGAGAVYMRLKEDPTIDAEIYRRVIEKGRESGQITDEGDGEDEDDK